jgi:cytochrome c
VAKKYKGSSQAEGRLAAKVIKGGAGVWGEQPMSAHPQLTNQEASEMVRYILSLANDKPTNSQPLSGDYKPAPQEKPGSYVLTASYTDRGNGTIGPLTQSRTVALRSPILKATAADKKETIFEYELPKLGTAAIGTATGSYIMFDSLDMTDIRGLSATAFASDDRVAGGKLEAHLDSPTGPLLGSADVKTGTNGPVNVPFNGPATGMHRLYLVFVNPSAGQKPLFALTTVQFLNQSM